MVGFWFYTSQFLQGVLGFSAFAAGLAFLATALPQFAAAMVVARLTHRFGNGKVLAVGLAITLAGLAWQAAAVDQGLGYAALIIPMVLLGLGQGLTLSPLTVAGIAGVPSSAAGAASGLVNVAHQLGGSLGLAVLVLVFTSAGDDASFSAPLLLSHRLASVFMGGAVMLGVALLVVVTLILFPRKSAL